MHIGGKSLRIVALISPFIFIAILVLCLSANRRDRHREAVLFGETHISTCFIERLREGDVSELTEKRANLELTALNLRIATLERKQELLAKSILRRQIGEDVSPEELRFANSGTGGSSCRKGDYEADAAFTADNFPAD